MESYIERILGAEVEAQPFRPDRIPEYIRKSYRYAKYRIMGVDCLFVEPLEFNLPAYKEEHKVLSKWSDGMQVVLLCDRITPYQRQILLELKLPFAVRDSQLYLPFLGTYLQERYANLPKEPEAFTPLTQLLYLYAVYNPGQELNIMQCSALFHCSAMSMSRSFRELAATKLFEIESHGRQKILKTAKTRRELLLEAENYFIAPQESEIFLRRGAPTKEFMRSGYAALAEKCGLSQKVGDVVYAISKEQKKALMQAGPEGYVIDEERFQNEGGIRVQVWAYDPTVLGTDGLVDDLSLLLSLGSVEDEQIQVYLNRLRRRLMA
ncbi:MAG: hypothetical protein IJU20_02605 [Clostridia bacterium]|nr:hypothetical protein [Clostridia bacterium]